MSLEDDLLKQRLTRIREIEALGYRGYGQRFEFTHAVPEILAEYGAKTAEELTSVGTGDAGPRRERTGGLQPCRQRPRVALHQPRRGGRHHLRRRGEL